MGDIIARHYTPNPQAALQALLQGQAEGSKGAIAGADRDAALKQMILGKQADAQNEKDKEGRLKSDLADLQGGDPNRLVKAGPYEVGVDPTIHNANQNMHNSASAIQHAQETYAKGVGPLQHVAQSAEGGLNAVNDPHQIGSMGLARTLAIKSLGLSRYNGDEGKGIAPETLPQEIRGFFNRFDDSSNPLGDPQKQAFNSFFAHTLDSVKQQHDMLKEQTLKNYQQSPYFDATRLPGLQSSLGPTFDNYLGGISKKYASNLTPTPAQPVTTQVQPEGGLGGFVNRLVGRNTPPPAAQAAPQQQPAAAPAAPQGNGAGQMPATQSTTTPPTTTTPPPPAPPKAPLSFEDFKAARARGEL